MVAPSNVHDRRVLQRWLAAIGLLRAAEESVRVDTPETNAISLLAAHAACESLLSLIVGVQPYRDPARPELGFRQQLGKAAALAAFPRHLRDDLETVHRVRNDFVHASMTVDPMESERAIDAARRLLEVVPRYVPGAKAVQTGGVASAVAALIDVQVVAIWLRYAEDNLLAGRYSRAADGCARALDWAIARTRPRLVEDRSLTREASFRHLRQLSSGLGFGDRLDSEVADRIEGIEEWVVPLALGLSPAAYADLRSLVGTREYSIPGGPPTPIVRDQSEISRDDARWAIAASSEVVFRLFASGSLRAGSDDQDIVERARSFIEKEKSEDAGSI
jgi:hypothetical protein